MKSETLDTLSATGTKTIVTGVSMTGWGWFTSNEFFGLIGAAVLAIAAGVFAVEGGYSNNPADPGGETNHGVTAAVARSHGYDGPMRELPKETAQQIYIGSYVEGPGFHRVVAISPAVGEELVDAGVNSGPGRAARWFQQALNHLSRGGADYPLVAADGQVGAQTLAAYQALERKRGRVKACELVLKLLDALDQLAYVLVTLGAGSPDETLSAAAWRTEQEGRILGRIFRPLIDLLAHPWERDHCRTAFESERLQRHLPKEYRP